MTKDDAGVWSVTTPVLAPEVYNYSFAVDGNRVPDPKNYEVHAAFGGLESLITVPGATPMSWELTSVPHGELTLHRFTTHVARNLPADQSSYIVYTPAGFDPKKKGGYPVLYLLHGYYDDQNAWTVVGRAHLVLDNMIASGKCVPMIVVMPLGYGNFTFLTGGFAQWETPANVTENTSLFEQSLETEVMPAVEREYPIAKDRTAHAISGLSMGGLETLVIGLHHPEQFAYVAGMSSATQTEAFAQHFPDIDAKKANFKLLWAGVGVDDRLLQPNRNFVTWAKSKGFTVTSVETPGGHQWPVWREDLVALLPQLFR
jgi:enterochelin esterase family protein